MENTTEVFVPIYKILLEGKNVHEYYETLLQTSEMKWENLKWIKTEEICIMNTMSCDKKASRNDRKHCVCCIWKNIAKYFVFLNIEVISWLFPLICDSLIDLIKNINILYLYIFIEQ